ncbi:MAG TPA: contact-dependent growth inhibition system immunity protein [Jatrophihabitans sp.]|nr:contact-dependent growth inhibition system immunity protein [Jatrophihabitans sp.]
MSNLTGLKELLHSYFHQDWVDDYPDPWDAVDEFIADKPQLAAGLPEEVNGVLQEYLSEAQLKQLFWDLRCGYYIEADNWTYRGWLTAVADRVKQATAA